MGYRSVISEDDETALRLFCGICERLPAMRFYKSYFKKDHKLVVDFEKGTTEYTKYDDEDLRSYLTEFRKLVMDKEPTFIYSIMKILTRYGSPETRKGSKAMKKHFKSIEQSSGGMHFLISDDGADFSKMTEDEILKHSVSPKEIFEAYAYGEVFHQTAKQRAAMKRLRNYEQTVWLSLVRYVMHTSLEAIKLAKTLSQAGYLDGNGTTPEKAVPDAG